MLYERIVELCKERGITIAKLEKLSGLGNATIRGWKNSSPQAETLKKVCTVLRVSMDEIMEDVGA